METRPNLFSFATSELSQDAMLTYWLWWAAPDLAKENSQLHQLGKELLHLLLGKHASSPIHIERLDVGRQRENIDVWAEINDDYFLIIEDKTDTSEHTDQIARYIEQAISYKDSKGIPWGPERVAAAYVKTGNESRENFPSHDITIVTRRNLLSLLQSHSPTGDHVFDQFTEHLQNIESETCQYKSQPPEDWEDAAQEGYCMELERRLIGEKLSDKYVGGWGYVHNGAGGFHAFYWSWQDLIDERCNLYLQIEDAERLQIRVDGARDEAGKDIKAESEQRYRLLERLETACHSETGKFPDINLKKSGRYRAGLSGGVADVSFGDQEGYIAIDPNGLLDMDETMNRLRRVADLLEWVRR